MANIKSMWGVGSSPEGQPPVIRPVASNVDLYATQGCVPNSLLSLVGAPKLAVVGYLQAGCSYVGHV